MTHALKTTLAIAIASTLLAASSLAGAAADVTSTTRDQRMDSALQNYRDMHRNDRADRSSSNHVSRGRNSNPGRFARAEESVKHGAQRTGAAVKNGASKVGGAVSKAGRKTADALRTTGDKIHSKIGD